MQFQRDPAQESARLPNQLRNLNSLITREKVQGTVLGTIVGDALGLPFETLTPGDIQQNFIKTTHYRSMASNPYFKDLDPHATYGTCSDDTQLSLAVMEGIVEARDFELESQVRSHLKQYRLKTAGWGPTTLEAHARLAEGISYRESASETPGRGKGNGVCIQLGPVAAFLSRHHYSFEDYSKQLVEFTEMTHKSYEAICATFAHIAALQYCLAHSPSSFQAHEFIENIQKGISFAKSTTQPRSDSIDLAKIIHEVPRIAQAPIARRYELCQGAGSSVTECLPMVYATFLSKPNSIEAMYDVINSGGDTDSTAAMVGALLGALNGGDILPEGLIANTQEIEALLKQEEAFACTLSL